MIFKIKTEIEQYLWSITKYYLGESKEGNPLWSFRRGDFKEGNPIERVPLFNVFFG